MTKKILVTGATGFIGGNTLELLIKDGYEVHGTSMHSIPTQINNIYWHHINLLDYTQINKLFMEINPTHLLHFAWYVNPTDYLNSRENLNWVQSSLEILKNFKNYGGERAVFAGTCFEYDMKYGYLTETLTPINPNSLYGTCKAALNKIVQNYCKENNLSFAWGRIFYLYGPNEYPNRIVPYVIQSLLKGEKAYCSHGNQTRDFSYVLDTASAFVNLLNSNAEGNFNIGSGKAVTLKEIINLIAKKLNKEDLIQFADIDKTKEEPSMVVANIDKLLKEVNWSPYYSLDEGLDNTIAWWKKHIKI